MKTTNSLRVVIQNMCSLALADIGNKVLLFLFFLISARYLGPKNFGIFSLAMAITNILVVITDFGTSSLGTREGARDYNIISKYISNIIFLKIFFCIIVLISGWFIINKLGYTPDKIQAVVMLFPSVVFLTFVQTFNAVFQATEKMFFIPLGKLIDGIILIGGIFLLIYFKSSTIGFIILYTIAALMVFIYSFLIVWNKFTHFTIVCEKGLLKEIIKETMPFAIGIILSTFYYWNSSALLSLWRNDTETGLFTASLRLVLGTTFIPSAFVGSIYPILSRTFVIAKEKMEYILEKALKYMIIFAIPLCFFTQFCAQKIIHFFYGVTYLPSAHLLEILIWWAGIIYLNAVFAHFFYSINKQSVIAIQTFLAVIVNVSLNLLLIRKIGARGACFSLVVAEFLSLVYLLINVIKMNPSYKNLIKSSIVTMLKSLLAFILPAALIILGKNLHLLVLSFVTLLLYFISFYFLKGFSKSDMNTARQLWYELKAVIHA